MNIVHPVKARGFTLIELLVVISIIALLIAILLPALSEAKRQAHVLTCLSGLKQIGLGLASYATESDGKFPTPCNDGGQVISDTRLGVDHSQLFHDMVNGETSVYHCAVYGVKPMKFNDDRPFDGEYFADSNKYWIGYTLFFLIQSPDGNYQWDWTHSGNEPQERPTPSSGSSSAIIADWNVNWPNGSGFPWPNEPLKPGFGNHMTPFPKGKVRETNVVYADGHGETHGTLQHYVTRQGNLGYYSY